MNRQTNMNEAKLKEENERWETHWVFLRAWLKEMVSVDNTVSTKHTIPVYAKVLSVMDELRPPTEGDCMSKAGQPISIDDAECAGGCEEHYLFCKCEVIA